LGLSADQSLPGVSPPVLVLTGGMGAGKSTAAQAFTEKGIFVLDADALVHALTGPGGKAVPALVDAFGPTFVSPETGLDRATMRDHVFQDPSARQRLEAIVHPLVAALALTRLAAAEGPYSVYMVPLWIERQGEDRAAWPAWAWRLLVIDLPESEQWQRVMRRSPMSSDTLAAILARQATRQQRLAVADYAIRNTGNPERLRASVGMLHARLCRASAQAVRTYQT
jgi:dephospho-CoA kinase